MSPTVGVPDTSQRHRNNTPDLLKAMLMKLSVKDERVWRDLARLGLLMSRMALD